MGLIDLRRENVIAGYVQEAPGSMTRRRNDAHGAEDPSAKIAHLKANCSGMVDPREVLIPIEVAEVVRWRAMRAGGRGGALVESSWPRCKGRMDHDGQRGATVPFWKVALHARGHGGLQTPRGQRARNFRAARLARPMDFHGNFENRVQRCRVAVEHLVCILSIVTSSICCCC